MNKCCICGSLTKNKKYCSLKCAHIIIHNNNKANFENAKSNRTRRRRLIDERGYKCEMCSIVDWMNKSITLELHHIDGNRNNNSRDNLKIVCPNCHALTDNYKFKNRK